MKLDDLLTILNSANNDIQISVELSDSKLPFHDIIITKSNKKYLLKTNQFKTLCFLPF